MVKRLTMEGMGGGAFESSKLPADTQYTATYTLIQCHLFVHMDRWPHPQGCINMTMFNWIHSHFHRILSLKHVKKSWYWLVKIYHCSETNNNPIHKLYSLPRQIILTYSENIFLLYSRKLESHSTLKENRFQEKNLQARYFKWLCTTSFFNFFVVINTKSVHF
jgi:hypothetical protein